MRPHATARSLLSTISTLAAGARRALPTRSAPAAAPTPPRLRHATRTDALVATLADRIFGTQRLDTVTHPGLQVVLTACDLRTGTAVRFGSTRSSCWRHGIITDPVTIATAVAASAAFPPLLPALERTFTFRDATGTVQRHPVLLTDGGVYDNLAITLLEPGRSAAHTAHAYDVRHIVACDAGRGPSAAAAPHFWPGRMIRSVEVTHRRAQDAGRARLHHAAQAGQLDGFVLAYLGMADDRLPVLLADLVPRDRVAAYPTDFRAMDQADLDALALRGEQLVRVLLTRYCPRLV